ncbi:hypothetical protein GMI70_02955 [Eggerthellaceae bacterium zg-893]|nr:hypothetical protein [Eggerthellaceae bacterium zg-893]
MGSDGKETIMEKLFEMQKRLKVEKKRFNSFGGFSSRSKEDVLEEAKPIAAELGCVILCDDRPVCLCEGGDGESPWVYVEATARLVDAATGESVQAVGLAREPYCKPKMDQSQTTGSASSYAGKRALGNLFALDDTSDVDQLPPKDARLPDGQFVGRCRSCGLAYTFPGADAFLSFAESAACCPNPDWAAQ